MRNLRHSTKFIKRRTVPGGLYLLLARLLGGLYTALLLVVGAAHALPWTPDRGLAAGLICACVLALVWSRPVWGAVLFALLAAVSAWLFRTYLHLAPFCIVTGPLALTSLFFLFSTFSKDTESWNFEDTAGVDS